MKCPGRWGQGEGKLDYSEFCEELARTEPLNNVVYGDIMDGAVGKNAPRPSAASKMLPKCAVEPLVHHAEKPKLWYFWNSPCAESTVWKHMKAFGEEEEFGAEVLGLPSSYGAELDSLFFACSVGYHCMAGQKLHVSIASVASLSRSSRAVNTFSR